MRHFVSRLGGRVVRVESGAKLAGRGLTARWLRHADNLATQ